MSGLSFRRRIGLFSVGALLLVLVLPVTAASAATSSIVLPSQTSQTVTVPANQEWFPTGINVSSNSLNFSASGTINVSGGDPAFNETPAGDGPADPSCIASANTPYGGGWVADGFPCWSLIGKVGTNGQPFEIGNGYHYSVSGPGQLYLSLDDQIYQFGDNLGSWTVVVTSAAPTVTFSPGSGPVGTSFTMTGSNWIPGGTVSSSLPYGSSGVFFGYQAPTVNANGNFSFQETVGTGSNGPTPPGAYTFTYVENYQGSSIASATQTFTVTGLPAAPSNLTVTPVDPNNIRLNWQDNSSNETGFEVNNGNVSKYTGANTTTYTWGGLAPGTYMCFHVRAYNSAGSSAWAPNVSPRYVCTTTPAPLANLPFISQYQGQVTQNFDCGPASVAMVVQAYNRRPAGLSNGAFITQVRNAIGNLTSSDTNFPQLERALGAYGLTFSEISQSLSPAPDAQLQAMKQAISNGEPVIVILNGKDLGRGSAYGDHWVVVKAFSSDGSTVYLNDPDDQAPRLSGWVQGGQISLPYSQFRTAVFDAQAGPYGIIVR